MLLDRELAKYGTTLKDAGPIAIAYPHKHPKLFPLYWNRAAGIGGDIRLRSPEVEWVVADAICETRQLSRTYDQSSVHALTCRQSYSLDMAQQKDPLPFLDPGSTRPAFFVIADTNVEQGTTVALLMSYITYNGGIVLGAVSGGHGWGTTLAQVEGWEPALARAFRESAARTRAGAKWTEEKCLEKFNAALKPHGNSLSALTNEECGKLHKTITEGKTSFPTLIRKLRARAPAP